jgi:hypothetical protein
MVWTLAPPNQRRPQGQGGEHVLRLLLPPATTTTSPSATAVRAQATRESPPREREAGVPRGMRSHPPSGAEPEGRVQIPIARGRCQLSNRGWN